VSRLVGALRWLPQASCPHASPHSFGRRQTESSSSSTAVPSSPHATSTTRAVPSGSGTGAGSGCASNDWPELSSPDTSYPSCQCSFRPHV